MDSADLQHRFEYHPPRDDEARSAHEGVRQMLLTVAGTLNESLPDGREKSTAITKLEEAMFWANAAIAREQKP